jgi:RNA polymerase sigma factor (sigma-70 family)
MEGRADDTWIRDARAGSAEAFSKLVQMHQAGVRGFLRRLSGQRGDADDIAQEVFMFAWQNLQRFQTGKSFRAWLCAIAYRKFLSDSRSRRRQSARDAVALSQDSCDAIDPALRMDLLLAVHALSAEERAALVLCMAQGFSHEEAADALGKPLGTVKSHVARGRQKMLEILEAYDATKH